MSKNTQVYLSQTKSLYRTDKLIRKLKLPLLSEYAV